MPMQATPQIVSELAPTGVLRAAINMGMTFPFYGTNFSQVKVGTNGFLTFDTTDTATRLTSNLPLVNCVAFAPSRATSSE